MVSFNTNNDDEEEQEEEQEEQTSAEETTERIEEKKEELEESEPERQEQDAMKRVEEEEQERTPDDVLPENWLEDSDAEELPENSCSRYEVCGNEVQRDQKTCAQCWEDIRIQLELPEWGCPENDCPSKRFKATPSGKFVKLECKNCDYEEVQKVDYTGDDELDPMEQAVKNFEE